MTFKDLANEDIVMKEEAEFQNAPSKETVDDESSLVYSSPKTFPEPYEHPPIEEWKKM